MPTRPSDQDLIRAFRDGHEAAFDALVERHMKRVHALAFRLTSDPDDADDVAQEAFVRAHRGLRRFRGDAAFTTWLTRITLNVARSRTPRLPRLEEVSEPVSSQPGALHLVLEAERSRRVRQAVATLPERQRQTLLLRVFEGMRFRDIAGVMGTTTGTAKANFFHALRGLARRLAVGKQP
jgi:RNA polymerase sigma-70 factor, ECF subfamily